MFIAVLPKGQLGHLFLKLTKPQGDADYICNWLGNYAWTEGLDWPGKKTYNHCDFTDFKLRRNGGKVGEVKSSGNLTFMRVHAAGHMVPFDQPEIGLEFFNRWIGGEWL